MKKIMNKACLAIAAVALTVSCSLNELNHSSVTSVDYIQGDAQYEELVNAAYMNLRPLYNSVSLDLMFYGTDLYQRIAELSSDTLIGVDDYDVITVSDGSVYSFWCDCYDIVTQCNIAMSRGEGITLSDQVKKARNAELQVLRAFAYFYLVENFGGVPLLKEEITNPTFEFTRESEQNVYEFIVSELESAINSGGLEQRVSTSNFGRIDQGCAHHLLGKVLLTRSYKSFAAASDLSSAISHLQEALKIHPLVSDWDTLFDVFGGKYQNANSEIILAIRFASDRSYNSVGNGFYELFKTDNLNVWPGLVPRDAPYWRVDPSFRAADWYLTGFEDGDVRGSEKYLVRHLYAVEDGSVGGISFKGSRTYGEGDEIIYMPNEYLSEEEKAAYMAEHPTVYLVVTPDQYNTKFVVGNNSNMSPFVYKFMDPNISSYGGSVTEGVGDVGTRDITIFRSAETKLLLAEAYIKQGQPGLALNEVNDIRDRAGASRLETVDLDVVLDEAGRELLGETNRWMDLKRCGKLFERAYKYNPFVRKHNASSSAIKSDYLLRPIPKQEIERSNNTLEQNPGYSGS